MIYDTTKTQIAWRGNTLQGFGSEKIHITQNSNTPSINTLIGIFGEFKILPSYRRIWTIYGEFLPTSPSYKLLLEDNLNRKVGTLVIRDLNEGADFTDIFSNCVITNVNDYKDGNPIKIVWTAVRRNLK